MKFLLTTPFLFVILSTSAQQGDNAGNSNSFFIPVERVIYYKLGERTMPITIQQYGEAKDIVFINLHANETTSVQAARQVLESTGGTLIKIENGVQRVIRFRFRGVYYSFDPNRIFSKLGIESTLKEQGRINPLVVVEVEKFRDRILGLFPEDPSCIVALHNNTNENYSVKSYLAGSDRQYDARAVYANPDQDPDDIAFTTDSLLYHKMAELRYNAIWQDNEKVKRDGSLSVWCGEKGQRYINIETEHGRVDQYIEMLSRLLEILSKKEEVINK